MNQGGRRPAWSSRVPCNSSWSFPLVSADAAWAVGVEPTESTNAGCSSVMRPFASSAALFTVSTSDDKNRSASSEEVDAYALPAWA